MMLTRFAAPLAALALLAGCATVSPPENGTTQAERDEFRQRLADQWWGSLGLADELRPALSDPVVVPPEDWDVQYVTCMNAAGFFEYVALSGGYEYTGDGVMSEQENLANYSCSVGLQVKGEEQHVLGHEDANFRYDYFNEVLVPCLVMRGIDVEQPPTRQEYLETYGSWNPYWSVFDVARSPTSLRELSAACPPVPPGVPDPNYFGLN